jgi:hypothetical protein
VTVLFGILCGIDVLIAAIFFYFFVWGMADGTVSAFNIGMWMAILAGIATILGAGVALRANGRHVAASLVLAVLAAPGLLFGLFFLVLIVASPSWK